MEVPSVYEELVPFPTLLPSEPPTIVSGHVAEALARTQFLVRAPTNSLGNAYLYSSPRHGMAIPSIDSGGRLYLYSPNPAYSSPGLEQGSRGRNG